MGIIVQKGAVLLAGSLLMISSLWGSENVKPITLTLHHFLSSKAPPHTKLLVPWVKEIEKRSNGKLHIEIFPSMSMGGKPNELYKQAKDGVADIVFTVGGYSPGVFPRSEVFELPTIHTNSSLKTITAANAAFEYIKDDFKDLKPLMIATTGPNQLHTVNKKITSVKDLRGLKLRSASRTGAWYIKELGAEPVGMPIPAVAQALAKNAIDGAAFPMEMFPPFKFQQLTQYSNEIKDGGGFGGNVLFVLMNEDRYNSLPEEFKKIIDETSGIVLSSNFAKMNDKFVGIGKDLQIKSGGEVVEISAEETKKFDEAGERTVQRWVKDMNSKGIDGQKIVDAVRKSINN